MKNSLLTILVSTLLFSMPSSLVFAGHKHYGYHYKPHHYHHKYYRHHYKHKHYYHYDSSDIWAGIGIGLLTGVFIHAITSPPPPRRTIVYTSPPPVIVHQRPARVYQTTYSPPPQPRTRIEPILRQVRITTPRLNVRFGPDLQTSIVTQLTEGTTVGVIGAAPDWLYIRTAEGKYGWVMIQYTQDIGGTSPVG